MPYQLNPEWLAAVGPSMATLPANKMIPKPARHDIASRRANADIAMRHAQSVMTMPDDVVITEHQFLSFDSAILSIYQFQPIAATAENEKATPGPAALYLHGGGMILGSSLLFDHQIAKLASRSGVPMFSVDYRLAPEHPHPTPVEDAYAALLWLRDHATQLGVDGHRVAVVGESAGGGIAAGVALMARDRKLEPPLAKQFLGVPMLDHRTVDEAAFDPEMMKMLAWKVEDNITGWSALLGRDVMAAEGAGVEDVPDLAYASPARAARLDGLPPAFLEIGTMDLFLGEVVEYARRMVMDGQSMVELHVYPGLLHGFYGMGFEAGVVRRAYEIRVKALQSF